MRNLLLASVAFSALLPALAPTGALAQCAPDPAADFDAVACVNVDSDGFASAAEGLEVTVESGAVVQNAGDAIDLSGAAGTVLVKGEVVSSGKGVDVGDLYDVENAGLVDAGGDGVEAGDDLVFFNEVSGLIASGDRGIDAGDRAVVTNDGLVDSTNDAIRVGDGGFVVNSGFLLSSEQEGVDAGLDLLFKNNGVIDVGDEGVQATLRATIVNDGLIAGVDDAIQIQGDADIENGEFGEIISSEGDGIDIDSGVVTNAGLIRSSGPGEAGVDVDEIEAEDGEFPADFTLLVINEVTGVIEGEFGVLVDPANTESQVVENAGRISGFGGTAIALGGGEDEVSAFAGAAFEGLVDGGDDFDKLLFDMPLDDFLTLSMLGGGAYELFSGALGGGSIRFANFEHFGFDGFETDLAGLRDALPPAPVPLPATAPLLLGGLALAAWAARRRA